MRPEQLNKYAQGLKQEVGQLSVRPQEREKLELLLTRASDIQIHVQEQLENRQDGASQSNLESAGHTASDIIQKVLRTMKPNQLNEYAHGQEQEARRLSERTNLGPQDRMELKQLLIQALHVQDHVQEQLANGQDYTSKRNLTSAGRKASRSIQEVDKTLRGLGTGGRVEKASGI
jgi:hypothetical protein